MKTWFVCISIGVGSALIIPSLAGATVSARLSCHGFVTRANQDRSLSVELKPSGFDANYLRAELAGYAMGVDTAALADKTLGLVILDSATNVASNSFTGLRRIPNSKVWMASLSQNHDLDGKNQTTIELACYLEER